MSFALSEPPRLTAAALAMSDNISLSGDTPVPTAPNSIDGDTEVGSDDGSPEKKKEHFAIEEDVEQARKEVVQPLAVTFPEGGAAAWCAVAGATLCLLSTFGLSNSFGVFQQYYRNNQLLGYQPSTISWIGSAHLCIVFCCSIGAGIGFDNGYFRYQLAFGSALWVFGMFMLSLSKTYIQLFLSQSVCLGIALGVTFGPALSCVGTYFHKNRAFTIGCAAAGAAIGAVAFPIMLNSLFATHSFGFAIRAVTYMMAGLLLASNLLMRPRNMPRKERKSSLHLLHSFVREPSCWLVNGGVFFVMMALFVPMFFIQVFTKAHLENQTLATYSLAILNATACFGRLFVGLIADRCGVFNTIIPFSFVMATMVFGMLGATTTGGTIVFLLLFGASSGGFVSIMASAFMSLAHDVSELGGIGFTCVGLAALIGSPIAGALLVAADGQYWAPCTFGGCSALLGCGLLVAARSTQVVRKGSSRV